MTFASSTPPSPKNERLFLLTLAGIQFTHILDFMIMMPLGPQLIRVLHITTHEFGLLLSSYTLTAAASGLLATTYVDRFDRRTLMLALYVLFIVATLGCGLAPNYTALLVARALAGAFGGVLGAMVQTAVADVIPFERRGKAMGAVMASFSLSTVAGVPLGLLLASHLPQLGWRAPFFFIAIVAGAIFILAYRVLPPLRTHLDRPRADSMMQTILQVAKNRHHIQAFVFIGLMMLAGFSVIPYIALYMTSNLAVAESFLAIVYLCGGAATFFSAHLIGRLADRHGKPRVFRWIGWLSFVPILITTHLVPVPLWIILVNATLFFVLVSGRMIPAMAMVSAVAEPPVRGTFMSMVSAVQMMMSGLASVVAGIIITRNTAGQIENYNLVGYLAVGCGLLAIWLGPKLRVAAT